MGTELYVQPSEGRLKLEVEVANDNALKWQNALGIQQERNKQLRDEVRELQAFIKDVLDAGVLSCGARRSKARELLKKK